MIWLEIDWMLGVLNEEMEQREKGTFGKLVGR